MEVKPLTLEWSKKKREIVRAGWEPAPVNISTAPHFFTRLL